ncbi:MAG: hypothetical protein QOG53_409 [Frankiales bacterium]|nr:hypothetical protein [Frankiales bacterium]
MASTTLGAPASDAHGASGPDEPDTDATGVAWRHRFMRPGWPLRLLFYGYPLWWVLGFGEMSFIAASIPMAVALLHRRLRAPRGFAVWLLFLVWVMASALVVFADAPGTVPVSGSGKAFTYAYRVLWYLAITVVLLYVGNLREDELPSRELTRMLGFMFCVVVAGGVLGVAVPNLHIKSVAQIVLPHALTGTSFVKQIVNPRVAEVQRFLGFAVARPTAPFYYTNSWGANLSLFLPFFLLAWRDKAAGWRRNAAPIVLLIALMPIVYSLNRALWFALIAMTGFVALRYTLLGKVWVLRAVVGALAVGTLVFFSTPLHSVVSKRLDTGHSNARRGDLAGTTVETTLNGSPVVGFGGTRRVQGSFASIAGGARPECPSCAAPPLGTQGHLWMLFISQGVIGAALFVTFFFRRFLRSWRDTSPYAVAGCAALIALAVEIPFYDLLGPPMFTVMIAVGLLWRSEAARTSRPVIREQLPAVRVQSAAAPRMSR